MRAQASVALGLPVKYQDPELMGLAPIIIEEELKEELNIWEGSPDKMRHMGGVTG